MFFSVIKTFCRLLDSLPQDPSFIQPILTQLVSYYDRCYGWYKCQCFRTNFDPQITHLVLATVRRSSSKVQGTEELKPAAAMAETGDLRDMLNTQWTDASSSSSPSMQKVCLTFKGKMVMGLKRV